MCWNGREGGGCLMCIEAKKSEDERMLGSSVFPGEVSV